MNFKIKFGFFLKWLLGIGLLISVASLILEYGFHSEPFRFSFHQLQVIAAALLTFVLLGRFFISENKLSFIKNNQGYFSLIFIFLLILGWVYYITTPQFIVNFLAKFPKIDIRIFAIQIYLIAYLLLSLGQINQLITSVRGTILRPILLIPLIFTGIILIGTLLLLMPRATSPENSISFIDALFTVTSATCVTGLVVKNTGIYFSRLGQLIILALIQVGALGIITFTTFFGFILGRRPSVREQTFLGEALTLETLNQIGKLVVKILIFVFIVEFVGAGLLFWQFIPYFGPNLHNFYLSTFHAVSAFSNAGFSLFSDSFMRFRSKIGINLIITSLIIIGGLGFVVIFDIFRWIQKRIKKQKQHLSLQSQVVLIISFFLIILGMLFIFMREQNGVLVGFSLKDKLLASYFQSVTARTAGFNTLSVVKFAPLSTLVLVFLMFIGASPGSTGGGIKTTGFGVIFATIRSWLLGRESVRILKRTLNPIVIRQAFCIFFLAIFWISLASLILVQTEKAPIIDVVFEEVSAFGTVGLSRGITSNLSTIGKLIIIVSMLFGRLGPLIIAMLITNQGISERFKYPEERVILG